MSLNTEAETTTAEIEEDAAADSSPATNDADVKTESLTEDSPEGEDLMEAVKARLDKSKPEAEPEKTPEADKEAEPSPTEAEKSEEKPAAEVAAKKDDKAQTTKGDDFSDVPFHKHPRFRQVLKRAKEAESKLAAYGAEPEAVLAKAKQVDELQGWVNQSGLAPEEFNAGLELMALMKHDPAKALEKIRPYVEMLQKVTGETLPDDLRQKVDNGELDEEIAREISKAKSDAILARTQGSTIQKQHEAAQTQAQEAQNRTALTQWEENIKNRDPDYPKKLSFVKDRMIAAVQSSPPRNASEWIALADKAYAQISEEMAKLVPRPVVAESGFNSIVFNGQTRAKKRYGSSTAGTLANAGELKG